MIRAILLFILLHAVASYAAPVIQAAGDRLNVRTDRVIAQWRGGELVLLGNAVTGETYTERDNKQTDAMTVVRTLGGAGDLRALDGWRVDGDSASLDVRSDRAGFALRVSVDPAAGDVIIRQSADSATGGIHGVRWALRGIDLKRASVVIPSSGGRMVTRETVCGSGELSYPIDWEAQMTILQARRGSLLIWSTDSTAQFKRLVYHRRRDCLDLGFETEPQAPFKDTKQVEAVEWRLTAFKGDWRAAAGRYREFLHKAYPPAEPASGQEWAKSIFAVATIHGRVFDPCILDALASKVDAAKTLLYLPDWRVDNYDVNYPDYTPQDKVRPFVDHAHELGFRVMLHTDLPGATPGNPAYDEVKDAQVRDRMSGELIGWYWGSPDLKYRFGFINPASSRFRNILVDRLKTAVGKTGADALHLDVSGPMWNDANGLIEGMNYCQGSMQFHRDLAAAMPGVVLGGESVNEITCGFERFVQRWAHIGQPFDSHPVCAFLFGDQCASYGYLGLPNPDALPTGFSQYIRVYEPQNVLPTLVLGAPSDLEPDKPYLNTVAEIATAWQTHEFAADFASKWRADEKCRYGGKRGAAAQVVGSRNGSRLLVNGKPVYEWVSDVDRIKSPWRIPNWPARDGDLSFGLDPERTYWLFPGESSPATISYLPEGVTLGEYRATPSVFGVTLRRSVGDIVYDLLGSTQRAESGVIISGKRRPLGFGATFEAVSGSCGGAGRKAILMHPPWKPTGSSGDDPWGDVFADYRLKLPDAEGRRLVMRFGIGLRDEAQQTDGATFTVSCNGDGLFSVHVRKGRWHDRRVDLTRFAGRDVTVRLQVGPGPRHDTTWDHALWSDVVIERSASRDTARLVIRPGGEPIAVLRSDRLQPETSVRLNRGQLTIEDLALPGAVFAILKEARESALPLDLLESKPDLGLLVNGLYRSGSVWGSGTKGEPTCGGIKRRGVNAHPPGQGRTVLTWVLRLPNRPLSLHGYAGLGDGAVTDGVGFRVAVNGEDLWGHSTRTTGWRELRVDLSRWAGQMIALDLITDAEGECYCDWANWGEIRLAGD